MSFFRDCSRDIKAAATQTELGDVVSAYGLDAESDRCYSWDEYADIVEEEGDEEKAALLRLANERWFELAEA